MLYWPERVTERCQADKSLAIAHGLDEEFFPGLREELRRQVEKTQPADHEDDIKDSGDENDEEDGE